MTSHFQLLFGMITVKKMFITAQQLVEDTVIQVREDTKGKPHRSVGTISTDGGYIAPSQIDEVLRDIAGGGRQKGMPLRAQTKRRIAGTTLRGNKIGLIIK